MFAKSRMVASQTGEDHDPANIKSPNMGWMIAFLFAVSFIGVILAEPLRKVSGSFFQDLYSNLREIHFKVWHLHFYRDRGVWSLFACNLLN